MTTTATIKAEFIIEKQGRRFVLAGGLLDAALRTFDTFSIETRLVVIGTPDNDSTWVVEAKVTCPNGVFVQMGDASAVNVGPMVKTRLVAMAETRAVTRALRLAVNAAALLPFDDVEEDAERAQLDSQEHRARPTPAHEIEQRAITRAEPTLAPAPRPPTTATPQNLPAVATEQQIQTIYRLAETRHQLDRAKLDTDCALRFHAKPVELSVSQAGAYIKLLQEKELSR